MENILQQITDLAFLGFSVKDIAIIIEDDQLVNKVSDVDSPESKAYNKGKLLNLAEFRKSVWETAKAGSSPAQTLWAKIIQNRDIDNV
jgi:hypothetical protein